MNRIKKCPYFVLLILSGLCVYAYAGFSFFYEPKEPYGDEAAVEEEKALEDGVQTEETAGAETAKDGQESAAASDENETENPEENNGTTDLQQGAFDEGSGEKSIIGITNFIYYEAQEVSSPYYSDPGKIALTTEYPYETAENDYFRNAAFIGDSRTIGLYDYSGLTETDFYCDNGFCAYLWSKGNTVRCQNTNKDVLLDEVMEEKEYGKIYVMLGMNDCGYGNVEKFQERYKEMIDMLHEKQPTAVIYLMANLHIGKAKSDSDKVYNNMDINAHNVAIAELADGEISFYLDANEIFGDGKGNLKDELTFDGVHLYAKGYVRWMEYIKEHAVVR